MKFPKRNWNLNFSSDWFRRIALVHLPDTYLFATVSLTFLVIIFLNKGFEIDFLKRSSFKLWNWSHGGNFPDANRADLLSYYNVYLDCSTRFWSVSQEPEVFNTCLKCLTRDWSVWHEFGVFGTRSEFLTPVWSVLHAFEMLYTCLKCLTRAWNVTTCLKCLARISPNNYDIHPSTRRRRPILNYTKK